MTQELVHIRLVEAGLDFCTIHDLAVHLNVPEMAITAVLTGEVKTVKRRHLQLLEQSECRARRYHD